MSEEMEKAFGNDFLGKYKESLKKSRIKRLEVTGVTREEIIELVKKDMKPEAQLLNYMQETGGQVYHLLLAETPAEVRVNELKWGMSVSFRWKGVWVGAIMTEQDIEKLTPETPYILVGRMKTKEGNSRTFYNFTTHGIITMDEISKHGIEQKTQEEEIKEKIEEHSEEDSGEIKADTKLHEADTPAPVE